MVGSTSTHWNSVEQWSPTLFLVGGALLVGHAALWGIKAFTDLVPPPDLFVMTGHPIGLAGLFGLYPVLSTRSPRLSRAALVIGSIAFLGWVGLTAATALSVLGGPALLSDFIPSAAVVLVPLATILTYTLFGAATLRLGEGSRTVGALVLAPAALIVGLLVVTAAAGMGAIAGVVFGGGLALSMLALGYRLHTWDRPPVDSASIGDATAG